MEGVKGCERDPCSRTAFSVVVVTEQAEIQNGVESLGIRNCDRKTRKGSFH